MILSFSDGASAIRCCKRGIDISVSKHPRLPCHIANEWLILSWHREYVKKLSQALREISCGHNEQAQQYWYEFLDFIRREENNIQPNLDVYRVIEVAKNYAGFKL
ncbi:tyrosinase family protein [Gardnerella vaginalis]|uniref:tyrosinase family protein n=1 Tax=Gardnerella vaginalis TaxID=2702 RepID=UPI0031FEE883